MASGSVAHPRNRCGPDMIGADTPRVGRRLLPVDVGDTVMVAAGCQAGFTYVRVAGRFVVAVQSPVTFAGVSQDRLNAATGASTQACVESCAGALSGVSPSRTVRFAGASVMSRSPRSGWAVSGETATSVLTTHRPCGVPKPASGQGFCRPPRFGYGQLFRRGTPPATECAAATVTNRKGNLTSIRRSAPRGAVIAVATAALAVRADANMTQPASPATVSILARAGFNIVPSRKVPAMALSRSVSRACRTTPTTSRSPDWHVRRRRAYEVPVKAAGGRTSTTIVTAGQDVSMLSVAATPASVACFLGCQRLCTARSCAASSCGCGRRPATHRSGRPAGGLPRSGRPMVSLSSVWAANTRYRRTPARCPV